MGVTGCSLGICELFAVMVGPAAHYRVPSFDQIVGGGRSTVFISLETTDGGARRSVAARVLCVT
jgi:hypothetical protein